MCLTWGLGTFAVAYPELPKRITVVFDTSRVPWVSMPSTAFAVMMATVFLVTTAMCLYVATRRRSFDLSKYREYVSLAVFLMTISAFLTWGAVVIHRGLEDWQDATGPGWWLILVIFVGYAGGFGAKYITRVIHEQIARADAR